MEHLRTLGLLDSSGKPFVPRIQRVISRLLPRLRRQFPSLQDEVVLTEVMEEAARRIVSREERSGPIDKLHGYAWVTIRSIATSRMRTGTTRIIQKTLESEASHALLGSVPASFGTAEDIERGILLRELLGKLTHEERQNLHLEEGGILHPADRTTSAALCDLRGHNFLASQTEAPRLAWPAGAERGSPADDS